MARGRMIDKALSTSARRAALHADTPELAEFAQALYPLLVAHADDWGCQPGDAFTIKHKVDPTSPRPLEAVQAALAALHRVGLIVWYDTTGDGSGAQWLFITNWFAHQRLRGHTTDGRSRPSPPPPESVSKTSMCAQTRPRGAVGQTGDPNRREQKGTEGKGTSLSNLCCTSDGTPRITPIAPAEAEAVLVFPVAGTSASRTWVLTAAQVAAWDRLYPGVDVVGECRRALAFVEANTRKTSKGMPRFLVAWLNRTVNQTRAPSRRPGGVALPGWAVKP